MIQEGRESRSWRTIHRSESAERPVQASPIEALSINHPSPFTFPVRQSRGLRQIAITLWLALSLLANAALAEEAVEAPPQEEDETVARARTHFERAVTLYRDGDLQPALVEFRASYRLNPLPQVLFNIAVTQRDLHLYNEAIETLHLYQTEAENEPEERRAQASELLEELLAIMANVRIECDQDGAELFVNGEQTGRTPIEEPLQLAAGQYDLELRLDGFTPWSESVEVHGGQQLELTVELEPLRREWYRQWWVWTIVGVVVAGTTAGIVAGTASQPDGAEFTITVNRGGEP